MIIQVNGAAVKINEGMTVKNFLISRNINLDMVVVEINLSIKEQSEWGKTILKEGDIMEILSFVGGGQEWMIN